jgi:ABC-2 type transport system ATP-binding protein
MTHNNILPENGMIQVKGLTKAFGSRFAINELCFHASKSEILGFLGPNGAGKTTTMRILTGYMPPTSGSAVVGGYDVIEHSLQVRRMVGYLPETVPLYPEMTVFEYLLYMAELRKVMSAKEQVGQVLKMVHMEERSKGYIGNLSKGMRQRIGLAQALLHHPQVLILDEPTIGLDPVQIIEVRNLIQEIGKEHTVLLSTHILTEAQQICDRVLIINNGKIVAEDSPEHLQSRLTGCERVMIQVRGEISALSSVIAAVQGVSSISIRGIDTLEFETTLGNEVRPSVARAVIRAGYDLLELKTMNVSLEEVFLQLTRDESPAPKSSRPTLKQNRKSARNKV